MAWKPKGWDEKLRVLLEKMPQANSTEGRVLGLNCFEAGATAMLEALRKQPDTIITTAPQTTAESAYLEKVLLPRHGGGCWAFIPDQSLPST